MAQPLSLRELLKAKLDEMQQPVQLRLFDDAFFIAHEVNHAMSLDVRQLYTLRDTDPDAFCRYKAIREATGKLRYAEKQWARSVAGILGLTN